MNSNKVIYGLIAIIVLGIVVFYVAAKNTKEPSIQTSPQPTNGYTGPQPTAIPLTSVKGTVVSVNGDTLVLSANGKNQTISLEGVSFIQKVTSGSIESGQAAMAMAKKSDIAPGQTLSITFNKDTNKIGTIIIEK